MQIDTIDAVAAAYRDDPATHDAIHRAFTEAVQATPALRRHRDHIEQNKLGFGDRAFHWLWKLLVDAMPDPFRFLEIGVYKGQVLSLIGMLAMHTRKDAYVFGVTPLNEAGDQYTGYPSADYVAIIEELQAWSAVPLARQARLIQGFSTDDAIKARCRTLAPFDMVYIDGCHDFHAVASDLIVYGELLKPGGYLLMDDASTELHLPAGIWPGHADVAEACRKVLAPDERFSEVCAVGHNRVWRKRAPR